MSRFTVYRFVPRPARIAWKLMVSGERYDDRTTTSGFVAIAA
jgi:hypothetical protein